MRVLEFGRVATGQHAFGSTMGHPADINAMNLLHSGRGTETAVQDVNEIMMIRTYTSFNSVYKSWRRTEGGEV